MRPPWLERRWWMMILMLPTLALLWATPLTAQSAMAGIVRDDSTARPLAGVEVLLGTTGHRTITNDAGRYSMAGLPAGRFQVVFRAVGYLPGRVDVLLTDGETTRANSSLVPSTVVLDPIEVTGESMTGLAGRGFHERMQMGFGRFYEPEELRELEHLKVSDVLRRKGGVQIRQMVFNGPMVAMNTSSRDMQGQLDCYMSVYLDGRMHWQGGKKDIIELERDPPPDLREFLGVAQIGAIEVYRSSAGIPVEFGGTSGQCGAVVIWTRRG